MAHAAEERGREAKNGTASCRDLIDKSIKYKSGVESVIDGFFQSIDFRSSFVILAER